MSSNKAVNDMLALLCSTFRCEIDGYQKRAYVRALDGIAADVLLAAADLLINENAAGRQFYPMPKAPDVKGACAKVIAKRQHDARQRHLAHCDHPSQWVYNPETRIDERCPCWTRLQTALQEIGTLALPPSREDAMEIGS